MTISDPNTRVALFQQRVAKKMYATRLFLHLLFSVLVRLNLLAAAGSVILVLPVRRSDWEKFAGQNENGNHATETYADYEYAFFCGMRSSAVHTRDGLGGVRPSILQQLTAQNFFMSSLSLNAGAYL